MVDPINLWDVNKITNDRKIDTSCLKDRSISQDWKLLLSFKLEKTIQRYAIFSAFFSTAYKYRCKYTVIKTTFPCNTKNLTQQVN